MQPVRGRRPPEQVRPRPPPAGRSGPRPNRRGSKPAGARRRAPGPGPGPDRPPCNNKSRRKTAARTPAPARPSLNGVGRSRARTTSRTWSKRNGRLGPGFMTRHSGWIFGFAASRSPAFPVSTFAAITPLPDHQMAAQEPDVRHQQARQRRGDGRPPEEMAEQQERHQTRPRPRPRAARRTPPPAARRPAAARPSPPAPARPPNTRCRSRGRHHRVAEGRRVVEIRLPGELQVIHLVVVGEPDRLPTLGHQRAYGSADISTPKATQSRRRGRHRRRPAGRTRHPSPARPAESAASPIADPPPFVTRPRPFDDTNRYLSVIVMNHAIRRGGPAMIGTVRTCRQPARRRSGALPGSGRRTRRHRTQA